MTIGTPLSICDHDIDTQVGNSELNGRNCDTVQLLTFVKFPIDVDEDNVQSNDFRTALVRDPDALVEKATTLTIFLHFLKLKLIVSDIQHTIYRVDTVLQRHQLFHRHSQAGTPHPFSRWPPPWVCL